MDPRVERLKYLFETMSRETVAELAQLYAVNARFKDPFNDVRGIDEIKRIFTHMFDQVDAPRFEVQEAIAGTDSAFLTWDFRFRSARMGQGDQLIHGATLFRFDPDGRVILHRDYWDAAEELYAKLPLIGSMMRWLQRRARA